MPEVSVEDRHLTPKLNVLALPSHTAILFALIALVVLGAALASLLPHSGLWWPPIVIGLTLLPLRAFLQRPDQVIRRQGLIHYDDETTAVIEEELASFGVEQRPTVLIADKPLGARAFGTFRRHYISFGRSLAQGIAEGLRGGLNGSVTVYVLSWPTNWLISSTATSGWCGFPMPCC